MNAGGDPDNGAQDRDRRQEQERHRWSTELHDNVCQILTVVKLYLEQVEKQQGDVVLQLGGADPLSVLDVTTRQRASDAGAAGVDRIRTRLSTQADASRALARLTDLAGSLIPKLFEADRRR